MDKWNLLALLVLVGVISTIDAKDAADADDQSSKPPKPFGIGRGSIFIGGRETDEEGTEIALKIYRQFIQYKRIFNLSEIDEDYYGRLETTVIINFMKLYFKLELFLDTQTEINALEDVLSIQHVKKESAFATMMNVISD